MNIEAEHVELAEKLAGRFLSRLPRGVDEDAYRGAALEALAKAAASYDPSRGQSFRTYASIRMWYAMKDEVRKLTGNSRAAFAAVKRGEAHVVRDRSGRSREAPFVSEYSLDAPVGGDDDGSRISLGEMLPARDELDGALNAAEGRRRIAALPARERFVVLARSHGYTQPEIGEMLGVTDCRISQLEAQAHKRVARAIAR